MKRLSIIVGVVLVLSCLQAAHGGTVVRFNTVLGLIDVELYDSVTPLTAANFLNYCRDGDYVNSIIHRSMPGFIVQGGGFTLADGFPNVSAEQAFPAVPTDPPVQNEFQVSNTEGTIAMAKIGGDPDSATSGWFFNLADNSGNLDSQNGGFTVFGEVLGSGMDVVRQIEAQQVWPGWDSEQNKGLHPAFTHLPLIDYVNGASLEPEHFVIINSITELTKGDVNRDGAIDGDDLLVLADNYETTSTALTTWGLGDFNADQTVNVGDLGIFACSLAAAGGAGGGGAAAGTLPEPATIVLLVAGGAFVLRRFRSRR